MATPNPNLIYRTDQSGSLTYAQLDGNFAYLSQSIANISSPFPFTGSAEVTGSFNVTGSTSLYNSGSTILSINGTQGEIFSVSDDISGDLLVVQSGSTDLFIVSASGVVTLTGPINFTDGSTIQSIPSSSGDGFGYATLELTPDANLLTDQYIVLDPTSPNHIHLRAGGTIDESTSYLYLGGEKANVLIDDFNHQVQINATAADSSSFSWTFGADGTLSIQDLLQLPVRSTNPVSPVEGSIMASGSAGSSKLYYYDGTTWVDSFG